MTMHDSETATPEVKLDWAYAHGGPVGNGLLRAEPEDFVVTEQLGYDPSGAGEHALLVIRKRNTNSEWVVRQLAQLVGVPKMDVGLAGMKDRRAVTTQAFSVKTTGRDEPDWSLLNSEQDGERIEVLSVSRHLRKLKRGELAGNHFALVLRQLDGQQAEIEQRLQQIRAQGIPNYFGEQRFGFDGNNLLQAAKMFDREIKVKDRARRGIYLSAVRAYLFNRLLSLRIAAGNWGHPIDGDWVWSEADPRGFTLDMANAQHQALLQQGLLIHAGPLWGDGRELTERDANRLEREIADQEAFWIAGLKGARMDQGRRALQVRLADLQWSWEDSATLRLEFTLPAGSYATSVIREICHPLKAV